MSTIITIKRKKILSPFDKFKKRISKEFLNKKYIGDINISDEEYDLLVKYAVLSFDEILNKYNHIIDPYRTNT